MHSELDRFRKVCEAKAGGGRIDQGVLPGRKCANREVPIPARRRDATNLVNFMRQRYDVALARDRFRQGDGRAAAAEKSGCDRLARSHWIWNHSKVCKRRSNRLRSAVKTTDKAENEDGDANAWHRGLLPGNSTDLGRKARCEQELNGQAQGLVACSARCRRPKSNCEIS